MAATSIMTGIVKPGMEDVFEERLHQISRGTARSSGHHGVVIIRPFPGARESPIVLHVDL